MPEMRITELLTNWLYDTEHGEEYTRYAVGENHVESDATVVSIERSGLRAFRVTFDDGSRIEEFNPNRVFEEPADGTETQDGD